MSSGCVKCLGISLVESGGRRGRLFRGLKDWPVKKMGEKEKKEKEKKKE